MSESGAPPRLGVGRIGAPHGLGGRVRMKLDFAGSETMRAVDRVWVLRKDAPAEVFRVRDVGGAGAELLLSLEGVSDRDAAQRLTGARVEVERASLPPLAPGEYYLVDLVGSTVVGPEGPLGEVVGVQINPSVDSAVVRLEDGRTAEVPLAGPWIAEIDAAGRRIELSSLDGLIV